MKYATYPVQFDNYQARFNVEEPGKSYVSLPNTRAL